VAKPQKTEAIRLPSSGNSGGWQAVRALMLLHALTGSVGTPGGVSPKKRSKYFGYGRWNCNTRRLTDFGGFAS
jgi:anaerobic selenocysteine-containing dehydrogenase